MAKSKLDGPAKLKVQSLATALDKDNVPLIHQRWSKLCQMLGGRMDTSEIRKLLTDDQAARLARMTSFQA